MTEPNIGHNSEPATRFAKDQLKSIIERIEPLEEEKKATADDIRDVYAEAKGCGYDTKIMRAVRSRAKLGAEGRDEYDALVQLYEAAIGQV